MALAILGIVLLGIQTVYYIDANERHQRPDSGCADGASCGQSPNWNSRPDFAACGGGYRRNREPPR